ncbi:MAG: DUF4265 domain-containing protein [Geodermatophilaceae bacterium]|nr:DUF4265 domain-containing protein [Geodermatophilaceae bacterium]
MTAAEHEAPNAPGEGLVKVVVELKPEERQTSAAESMWAGTVSENTYRLRNSPFYAHGLSFGDTVSARSNEGGLMLTEVTARGGHSTYRVFLRDGITQRDFEKAWQPLEGLGCTYEGATKRLLSIDVPPEADIHEVYRLLQQGEAEGVWAFEEGHCGHPLREQEARP